MSKKTNLIVGAAATVAATSLLVGCNLYGKEEKYTITFVTNGGEMIAPVEIEWGEEYKVNVVPSRTGYAFKGWFFDAELSNPVSDDLIIEGDISLFAKWEINQYTITFDTNGGNEIASVKANYDTEIEVADPVRKGYEFQGWYVDEEYEKEFEGKVPGEDLTIYAKWQECELEISFNMNAGDATGEMGKVTFKTEDEKLILPECVYVREGYHFKGWSTTENGAVEFEDESSISSLLDESQKITLYAIWEAREYDLHFVSDGLAYGEDIKVKYEQNIVLPETNPSKEGHAFLGWGTYGITTDTVFADNKVYYTYDSISKIYSVANVSVGETVIANTYYEASMVDENSKMPKTNLTLNAIWSINSYTISFNSKGAGEVSSITQAFGGTITLPTNIAKTGYSFKGWYKDETLQERFTSTTMPLNGATLYAKWEANKYSIYFNANTGSGTMSKLDATYDVEVSLTANLFSKVGYSFTGWNTKEDGTGTSYTNSQEVKNLLSENESSLILYAQWKANTDTKYVVNHYTKNLDGSNKLHQSDNLEGESDKKVSIELLTITGFITPEATETVIKADGTTVVNVYYERASYKVTFTAAHPETLENFIPSSIDVKYEDEIDFPSSYDIKNYSLVWKYGDQIVDSSTKITGEMTLVAEYTRIEKTIVIHSEGQQNVNITNIDAGSLVISSLTEPTKTGYSFAGWYLDANFEDRLADNYLMPEDNLDIYVKWKINQYTISFDSGLNSITQDYGTSVTLPTPEKTGYVFDGWLRNGQPYSISSIPAESVSLTAKWEAISYSIVFNANSNDATGSTTGMSIKYDETKSLSANGFYRKGYSFLGWSLDKDALVPTYTGGAEITNLTSEDGASVTLYAIWEINQYTYNFIIVDGSGSVVETLYSQTLSYNYNVVSPNTDKLDNYPLSYKFVGWYSDNNCSSKVDVDEKAYTENESKVVNYYGKYESESYKVQFRNGNDGIIWETSSDGDVKDELTNVQNKFYEYVRSLYYRTNAYSTIYDALTDAINGDNNALTYLNIYLTCYKENTQIPVAQNVYYPFNSLDANTKAMILVQKGPTYGATISGDEANALAAKVVNTIGSVFDVVKDATYLDAVMASRDMNTMTVSVDMTSKERALTSSEYTKYKNNAYAPYREGYIFNGWKIVIDETNNIKIVDATWVRKLETPINVRVQSTTKNSVIYAWNQVEGASSYSVTYTIKKHDGTILEGKENVVDTTSYLSYEIEGLASSYTVENFKVKANNPCGSTSNKIELPNDAAVAEDSSVVKVLESTQIDSEYSNAVSYEHIVIDAPEFDESDIGPNYYRDKNNRIFYFFEATAYEFKGVEKIEVVEGNQYAYYENGQLHINENAIGQKIVLAIKPSGQEEIEYSAYVQPKITSISFGNNLNTYLDAKQGKAKYLNKDYASMKYLVGAASNDETKAFNGYSYEDELTEKTYYNGFKFDINVDTISGDTYTADEFTKDQFQLAYKFYDLSNPLNTDADNTNDVITAPQDLYIRDVENDVLYFLPSSGNYRVDISYKTDGYYLTEDKTPIADKKYYTKEGIEISNVGNTFNKDIEYYERYVSVGLQNNIKEDPSSVNKFNLSFNISLDDSINIYDNKSLRKAYGDPNVGNITLHANIKANFATDQVIQEDYFYFKMPKYNKDKWFGTYDGNIDVKEGTAVFSNEDGLKLKIWNKGNGDRAIRAKDGNLYHYVGDGGEYALVDAEWVNNWESGQFVAFNDDIDVFYSTSKPVSRDLGFVTNAIYQREFNNMPNGLTLNGNYFKVDASDAPYVKSDQNSAKTGTYHIQNTRAIIFETTRGKTSYNNLTVIGNTQNFSSNLGGSTGSTMSIEEYMNRTSGGLLGFKAYSLGNQPESNYGQNTDVSYNNIVVENTYVGISIYRKISIDVNYVSINNSWSNSIVSWNANEITLRNSILKNSGGSSLHINDGWIARDASGNKIDSATHPDYGNITCNPSLNIDFATCEIDNYISGEEPWFKQHGMEVAALNLKSGLEGLANNFGKTIIQVIEDPVTGLQSEKINFLTVGMVDSDVASDAAPLDKGYDLTLIGFVPLTYGGVTYQNIPVPDSTTGDTFSIYTNGVKFFVEYVTVIPGAGPVKVLVEMITPQA